jgi:hypothetical protein
MVKVIVRNFFGKRSHNGPLETPRNLFSGEPHGDDVSRRDVDADPNGLKMPK